jgi:Zn-dependent protease
VDFTLDHLALGLVWYVVFVFSTTCHEAAHAVAALRLGDSTAYRGGQVTLNPLPHIRRELFGMVLVPILTFLFSGWMLGWASAPYDPDWAQRHPKKSALMALAGPLANLALVVVAALLIRLGMAAGWFAPASSFSLARFDFVAATQGGLAEGLAAALGIAFALNLLLAVFNLFPVPPLDGSGVVQLVMSEDAARRYQQFLISQPMLTWVGLLIAWRLFDPLFEPLMLFALSLLYPGVRYG